MTNEEIKAALTSAQPVQIVLTEEEAAVIEVAFGGDRAVADNYKARVTTLFQEALDRRVDQIVEEARQLIEQSEQEQAELQHIALDLLKDKIIERMTPRLSLLQREKLKSYAVSWEVDLLGADPFAEFIYEAAGYLGMTPETLWSTYGHHHPDYQRAAATATGKRQRLSLIAK